MLSLDNLPKNGTVTDYEHRGAKFPVTITSSRVRYGQIDVELTPVNGTGHFWVRYDSLAKTATQVIETL